MTDRSLQTVASRGEEAVRRERRQEIFLGVFGVGVVLAVAYLWAPPNPAAALLVGIAVGAAAALSGSAILRAVEARRRKKELPEGPYR